MTNPKLDEMRAGIEREIKAVDETLTTLRTQKADLAAKIRAKVEEQTELRSALARLTPRQRKAKEAAVDPETVEGAVA